MGQYSNGSNRRLAHSLSIILSKFQMGFPVLTLSKSYPFTSPSLLAFCKQQKFSELSVAGAPSFSKFKRISELNFRLVVRGCLEFCPIEVPIGEIAKAGSNDFLGVFERFWWKLMWTRLRLDYCSSLQETSTEERGENFFVFCVCACIQDDSALQTSVCHHVV